MLIDAPGHVYEHLTVFDQVTVKRLGI